jgi:hypothetical protein
MSLQQWKDSIQKEAKDIENRLERGQNTPSNIQRLEQINEMLEILGKIEKPNSIFKKALNQK